MSAAGQPAAVGAAHHAGGALDLILPAALLLAAAGYLLLAVRPGERSWPLRRTVAFTTGAGLVWWALLGPLTHTASYAASAPFSAHMAQHLLVGMLGPYLMVLGAPMRLVLAKGPARWRTRVAGLLHTRYVRVISRPEVALFLSVGTLPVLYGTGLFAATAHTPWLHAVLHWHYLASGYLFAWVICGPDPAPSRPGVPVRLVVLGVAIAVHASVSQLLYAGWFAIEAEGADLRLGATLMYYGGDLVELALALTLVAGWRPRRSGRGLRSIGPFDRPCTAAVAPGRPDAGHWPHTPIPAPSSPSSAALLSPSPPTRHHRPRHPPSP